mmetsp:Transcript_22763/g.52671  ORF Transcript_22763/g.52671 Transcript_22763/m.52671 type:complete len:203 (+) Transcript_22763:292-900(+)
MSPSSCFTSPPASSTRCLSESSVRRCSFVSTSAVRAAPAAVPAGLQPTMACESPTWAMYSIFCLRKTRVAVVPLSLQSKASLSRHLVLVSLNASFKALSTSRPPDSLKLLDCRKALGKADCTKWATLWPKGPWPSKTPTKVHMSVWNAQKSSWLGLCGFIPFLQTQPMPNFSRKPRPSVLSNFSVKPSLLHSSSSFGANRPR